MEQFGSMGPDELVLVGVFISAVMEGLKKTKWLTKDLIPAVAIGVGIGLSVAFNFGEPVQAIFFEGVAYGIAAVGGHGAVSSVSKGLLKKKNGPAAQ